MTIAAASFFAGAAGTGTMPGMAMDQPAPGFAPALDEAMLAGAMPTQTPPTGGERLAFQSSPGAAILLGRPPVAAQIPSPITTPVVQDPEAADLPTAARPDAKPTGLPDEILAPVSTDMPAAALPGLKPTPRPTSPVPTPVTEDLPVAALPGMKPEAPLSPADPEPIDLPVAARPNTKPTPLPEPAPEAPLPADMAVAAQPPLKAPALPTPVTEPASPETSDQPVAARPGLKPGSTPQEPVAEDMPVAAQPLGKSGSSPLDAAGPSDMPVAARPSVKEQRAEPTPQPVPVPVGFPIEKAPAMTAPLVAPTKAPIATLRGQNGPAVSDAAQDEAWTELDAGTSLASAASLPMPLTAPPQAQPTAAPVSPETHTDGSATTDTPSFGAQQQAPAPVAHQSASMPDAAPAAGAAVAQRADTPFQSALAAAAPAQAPAPAVPHPHVPTVNAHAGRLGHEMGVEIARRISEGSEELTVRLNPVELGRIDVKLSFDEHRSLRAVVAAESPMALDMLRRDSADLGRALSDAGVRTDAQSFRFDSGGGSAGGDQFRGRQQANGQPNGWYRDTASGQSAAPEAIYRPLRTSARVDLLA